MFITTLKIDTLCTETVNVMFHGLEIPSKFVQFLNKMEFQQNMMEGQNQEWDETEVTVQNKI